MSGEWILYFQFLNPQKILITQMNTELSQTIAAEIQLFQSIQEKENFLFLIGALLARVISLKKAAEIMQLEPAEFLKILDLMGIEFSYLSEEDISAEKSW
jgi:predicted HTH domain antitoxin